MTCHHLKKKFKIQNIYLLYYLSNTNYILITLIFELFMVKFVIFFQCFINSFTTIEMICC